MSLAQDHQIEQINRLNPGLFHLSLNASQNPNPIKLNNRVEVVRRLEREFGHLDNYDGLFTICAVQNLLGALLFYSKESTKAILCFKEVLKKDENNKNALANLAFVYQRLHLTKKSKDYIERLNGIPGTTGYLDTVYFAEQGFAFFFDVYAEKDSLDRNRPPYLLFKDGLSKLKGLGLNDTTDAHEMKFWFAEVCFKLHDCCFQRGPDKQGSYYTEGVTCLMEILTVGKITKTVPFREGAWAYLGMFMEKSPYTEWNTEGKREPVDRDSKIPPIVQEKGLLQYYKFPELCYQSFKNETFQNSSVETGELEFKTGEICIRYAIIQRDRCNFDAADLYAEKAWEMDKSKGNWFARTIMANVKRYRFDAYLKMMSSVEKEHEETREHLCQTESSDRPAVQLEASGGQEETSDAMSLQQMVEKTEEKKASPDMIKHLRLAEEYYLHAISMNPTPQDLSNLATVYQHLAQKSPGLSDDDEELYLTSASDYFNQAVESLQSERRPEIHRNHGDFLKSIGEERQAIECFKRAMEVDTHNKKTVSFHALFETLLHMYKTETKKSRESSTSQTGVDSSVPERKVTDSKPEPPTEKATSSEMKQDDERSKELERVDTEAPTHSTETQVDTEAPTHSAETQVDTKAPTHSAETQVDDEAPTHSAETQVDTKAPTHSAETQVDTKAPTHSAETQVDDEAPTHSAETQVDTEAPTHSTETQVDTEAPTHSAETQVDTKAPTHSAETQVDDEAPTHSAETQVDTKAPTHSAETQVDTKAPTHSAETQVDTEAPTHSAETQVDTKAPTHSAETQVDDEAPTHSAETQVDDEAPTHSAETQVDDEAPTHSAETRVDDEAPTHSAETQVDDEAPTHSAETRVDDEAPTHSAETQVDTKAPTHSAETQRELEPELQVDVDDHQTDDLQKSDQLDSRPEEDGQLSRGEEETTKEYVLSDNEEAYFNSLIAAGGNKTIMYEIAYWFETALKKYAKDEIKSELALFLENYPLELGIIVSYFKIFKTGMFDQHIKEPLDSLGTKSGFEQFSCARVKGDAHFIEKKETDEMAIPCTNVCETHCGKNSSGTQRQNSMFPPTPVHRRNIKYEFDFFVIFMPKEKEWVYYSLLKRLEGTYGYKGAFAERDFRPGKFILQEIQHVIENSFKALVVLSEEFDTMTKYHLDLAQAEQLKKPRDHFIIPIIRTTKETLPQLDPMIGLDAVKDVNWEKLLLALDMQ